MQGRTLLSARWVIGHQDGRHVVHENGVVVIEGSDVLHVGAGFDGAIARRIDYGEAVISPGFIDLDALSDLDTTILGYDNGPAWKKGRVWPESYIKRGPYEMYSPEELAFQKHHAFAQLIRNGITTALPIASLFYRAWGETVAEFEAAAAAAEALGLRVYLGPAYRTGGQVTDNAGNIRAVFDEARGLAGLAGAADFARHIDGTAGGRIRAMFAPTGSRPALRRCYNAPQRLRQRWAHRCASIVASRQSNCGWYASSTAAHQLNGCTRSARCSATGCCHMAHKPPWQSLTLLQRPTPRWCIARWVSARHGGMLNSFPKARAKGINIGLGTDTHPADMIVNMQIGMMTARMAEGMEAIRSEDMFDAATLGGAEALNRPDLGRLAPGAKADISVIDLSRTLQTPDPVQTLMTSACGRDVRDVWIDGRQVMADGVIPGIDAITDAARAQAQFDGLIAKYPDRTAGHPPVTKIFTPSFERAEP